MSDDEGSSPPSELTQQRHVKDTSTQLFEKHERTHRYNHKIHRLFTLGRFDDCKQQIAVRLDLKKNYLLNKNNNGILRIQKNFVIEELPL